MKTKQFPLTLDDGETIVTCNTAGQGPRIAYFPGPGSFYFTGLEILADEYTFVACDEIWTYSEERPFGDKKFDRLTKEEIKKRDHLIVNALKKHYNTNKIDGVAFSGPGAVLFEQALEYPEDFDRLIGTGIGLTELDPSFKKTDQIFYNAAEQPRKEAYIQYQTKFSKLDSILKKESPVDDVDLLKFFAIKESTTLFPLKPHKRFLAETIAMAVKLSFIFDDPAQVKEIIIKHWKHNPFKEHVDKNFQKYFFENIFPALRPLQTILALAKSEKEILLIYGVRDYVTPITTEILKELSQYPAIKVEIMNGCGHIPYVEDPEKYSQIVKSFINSEYSCQNFAPKPGLCLTFK